MYLGTARRGWISGDGWCVNLHASSMSAGILGRAIVLPAVLASSIRGDEASDVSRTNRYSISDLCTSL